MKHENSGAVGAAMDEYYDEEEDQNFDDLDSEQMMKMIE